MSNFLDYLQLPPMDFSEWIVSEFIEEMPISIETTEDLQNIAEKLGIITNRYSFIMSFLSFVKIETREAKRKGDKVLYEDMIDRKETLQNTADTLKMQYQSLSRLITIRQEINRELNMSEMM